MEMIHKLAPPISILVVEENDLSREILATIIPKRFPQAIVYSAANCKASLDFMKTRPPNIIITDSVMSEVDGVRKGDRIPSVKPDTKLIVITADSERQVWKDAALSSIAVDHYLFKPISCPDLFAAIEQCIAKVSGETAESAVPADEHAEEKAEQTEEQRRHESGGKTGYPEAVDQRCGQVKHQPIDDQGKKPQGQHGNREGQQDDNRSQEGIQ